MKLFLVTALGLTAIALAAHSQELTAPAAPPPPMMDQAPVQQYPAQAAPMPPIEQYPAQQAIAPGDQSAAPIPPPTLQAQRQGNVTFISGGAGDEDRQTLQSVKSQYNLRLQFALQKSGEFLADVNVTVVDGQGRTILDTNSDGPLFYAQLPAGHYKLTVTNQGQAQTRSIAVSASGAQAIDFYWPSST
jgi:hypothetical protein